VDSVPGKRGNYAISRQALDESHLKDYERALFYVAGSFNDSRAYVQRKARLEAVDQAIQHPREPRLLLRSRRSLFPFASST